MTIERHYGKKTAYYAVLDNKGGILAHFPTLAAAGIVKRFLEGDTLTSGEMVFAIECINGFDAVNSGKNGEKGDTA